MQQSRRSFLKRTLGAAAVTPAMPALVPSSVLGQNAPSNRIAVGCIGVGPQGRGVMSNFLRNPACRVIALSDISGRNLAAAVKMVHDAYQEKTAAVHHFFQDLLERRDIDAVLIATPDHWHVPVAIAAAESGKDMYLEKPMGLSVEDDQALRRVCQARQRIFQFGTQQRSSAQFRQACQLVRNGRIGKLKHITVWCAASRPGGSTAPMDPPKDLDYPTWLGAAPKTPYTLGKAYDEDGAWKTWWYNYDYALGFIAGWGVHPLDIACWGHPAMMNGPMEIEGRGDIPTQGACNTSVAWDVRFRFADGVTMEYRGAPNGAGASPLNDLAPWQQKYGKIVDHGTGFEGTDGWIMVDRTQIRTSPEDLVEDHATEGAVQLVKSANHVGNFLDSIRSRRPAICPIEDAVHADILCHLSDIATRMDRKLRWDPKAERFVDDAAADLHLKRRV
ncbi:MAG: Gfo/Idh/MocA family oxidoreductase [Verrucomicrobiales bacterium]|nr:Gfo/Idh/MocA family oxidoreductase [Verrucomicrobiales bacterium]MCP5525440.1 Gfo/Idh/MocA family oxidoreductase [Verrucomicrobiales bacterium]